MSALGEGVRDEMRGAESGPDDDDPAGSGGHGFVPVADPVGERLALPPVGGSPLAFLTQAEDRVGGGHAEAFAAHGDGVRGGADLLGRGPPGPLVHMVQGGDVSAVGLEDVDRYHRPVSGLRHADLAAFHGVEPRPVQSCEVEQLAVAVALNAGMVFVRGSEHPLPEDVDPVEEAAARAATPVQEDDVVDTEVPER
ncbi:hypothetical protein [Streptomyces finlayi]|uniref:hypothetical protein n=1 Tax=Streptomyces finlayi TaxID=67296 RepID=UPI0035BBB621